MQKLAVFALLLASVLCSAEPVSKEVRLKHIDSDNVKSMIQDGKLKLSSKVSIAYSSKAAGSLTISGEDKDVKAAENAIAALDVVPEPFIIKVTFTVDGKIVNQPIIRTLGGYSATIHESISKSLENLELEVIPFRRDDGSLYLQSVIKVNDLTIIVPTGVQSGDSFSYAASKSAYYLRWSRAGKTFVEYPMPEAIRVLGNTKITITFEPMVEQ